MYTQVWKKFLPLIRLMIKKSVTANQVVKMNRTDFDKAGGGKKAGFTFTLDYNNGRVENRFTSLIAKDLVTILQDDEVVRATLAKGRFQLDMNPKCELNIKFIAAASVADTSSNLFN